MEGRILRLALIFAVLIVCFEPSCASNSASARRFIDQLNKFKTEIRDDVSYINTDISNLYKSVDEIKAKLQLKWQENEENDSQDANEHAGDKGAMNIGRDSAAKTDTYGAYSALQKAFESEKRMNRVLQKRLDDAEATISEMSKDMKVFMSFMEYVNDTLNHGGNFDKVDEDGSAIVAETTAVVVDITDEYKLTTTEATLYQSCENVPRNGVHEVYFESLGSEKLVYCDADTDDGGWIVIMRRQDGSVDFDRSWDDYKNGFGNVAGEFWIGNDFIHRLTKAKPMELRIDMEDFDGNKAFAVYEVFEIGSETDKYKLTVSGYKGTAGDSLMEASKGIYKHNGMKFSTKDSDNDKSSTDCAELFSAGWWFNKCFSSILTGKYSHTGDIEIWKGIIWESWKGMYKALKFVEMKIR